MFFFVINQNCGPPKRNAASMAINLPLNPTVPFTYGLLNKVRNLPLTFCHIYIFMQPQSFSEHFDTHHFSSTSSYITVSIMGEVGRERARLYHRGQLSLCDAGEANGANGANGANAGVVCAKKPELSLFVTTSPFSI